MSKDFHEGPFDDGTNAKLEIFEDYLETWLPTFIMQKKPVIRVFDFFAGPGYDVKGTKGSPIRIFEKIEEYKDSLYAKGVEVEVFLNELDSDKFEALQSNCESFFDSKKSLSHKVHPILSNEEFESIFPKAISKIEEAPSLIFVDQTGVKYFSIEDVLKLGNIPETDFLYFISSSFVLRFGNEDAFKRHLSIDVERLKEQDYKFIHRKITEQLKDKLPKESPIKLYPFSIKKRANIYGIIFGSSHIRAVDKFLNVAWNRDRYSGDANFDIEEERSGLQQTLFSENKTKVESFKDELKEKVLSGKIRNNIEALNFSYEKGHIGSHASNALKEMKRNGEIFYEGRSPCTTYEKAIKHNGKLVEFEVLTSSDKSQKLE